MDCTNLAADLAQAFSTMFDVGTVYGAGVFVVGFLFGFSVCRYSRSPA